MVRRGARFVLDLNRALPRPRRPPRATTISSHAAVSSPTVSPVSDSTTTVPAGTRMRRSAPLRPVRSLPCPCRPRSARKRRLNRKSTSVLRFESSAQHDVTAVTAVTAVRTAPRDVLLPPEAQAAISAGAGFDCDRCLVDKLHSRGPKAPREGRRRRNRARRESARSDAHVLPAVRAPALEHHHPVGGAKSVWSRPHPTLTPG